jgi:hypothetical protein
VTDLPHFAYPFRFGSPGAVVNEQDSLDEIADAALVALICPAGFRVELPEFGLPDPTFTGPVDVDVIRRTVEVWEPRAFAQLEAQPDQYDVLVTRVLTLIQLRTEE